MGNDQANDLLAEKIARVLVSVDLADVASDDIDAFLDSVECEPFSEAKVQRILRRALPGGFRAPRAREATPARAGRRAAPYRLTCEQLERRLSPSVFVSPLGGRPLDAFPQAPTDLTVEVVRVEKRLGEPARLEFREHDRGWGEASPLDPVGVRTALTQETLSSVFASQEYQSGSGFEDAGFAGEDMPICLAWNYLDSQSAEACESAPLQLAG
jgi:hypothetical protein